MEQTPSLPPARAGRILVVEPNRTALGVLTRRLAEAGYRVVAAENGAQAVAEMLRSPVDLVLSDLRMKPMSGVELVRLVRDDAALAPTPVILITGKSDASGAVEGFAAGADDVVAKPFHFEVLLARIARRLARARQDREMREAHAALDARVVAKAIELVELKERLDAIAPIAQRPAIDPR